jgi:hypothetical protein
MTRTATKPLRHAALAALAAAPAGCASPAPALPAGPLDVRLDVVERGWHTDLCVDPRDIIGRLATLAAGFPQARVLCFGFGERQYMMEKDHSVGQKLASLLPSSAVLLVVALHAPPAEVFPRTYPDVDIVNLHISRAGAASFADFVWRSVQTGADGTPLRLGEDQNADNVYFAASTSYNALATCNTWAATGLRMAGLPVSDAVIFPVEVMTQVRALAAAQQRQVAAGSRAPGS